MASVAQSNAACKQLLEQLEGNLKGQDLGKDRLQPILEQLKVYGRNPSGAQAIYCESGIVTLGSYALGDYDEAISSEALRCIANALLLQANLRQIFVDHGYADKAVFLFERQDSVFEFLIARILFLLTYETTLNVPELIKRTSVSEYIRNHLARHAQQAQSAVKEKPVTPQDEMAMVETLKLIYNICSIWTSEAESCSECSRPICTILRCSSIPSPPLQPPLTVLINALVYTGVTASQTDDTETQATMDKLIQLLDQSIQSYRPSQLETQLIPLLTVIRQAYDSSSPPTRQYMQQPLLPFDIDRLVPLGQSDSVSSRLIKLTVEPGLINLPEAVSSLFFELSDKDPSTFVRNIGYGHAAGYLMTHKISIPESARQTHDSALEGQVPINPITGQRLDREEPVELPDMSQEEKEQEAERLYVLFERLRATGVVDVKNPAHEAMESRRFEELSDSDDD